MSQKEKDILRLIKSNLKYSKFRVGRDEWENFLVLRNQHYDYAMAKQLSDESLARACARVI